ARRCRRPYVARECWRVQLRGGQLPARARVPFVGGREAAGRQGDHPRRDHPRQQHRRASAVDCRAPYALCQAGRPRAGDRRRRLRLLLAGLLPNRGASDGDLDEVPGIGGGSTDCKSPPVLTTIAIIIDPFLLKWSPTEMPLYLC